MAASVHKVRTPLFPLYSDVGCLLSIWAGVHKSAVLAMINAIWEQTGTPQHPVDWSDPDSWINERLSGESQSLARRIWAESGKTINPRHVYGAYLFINTHALLQPDEQGCYRLTDRGRLFLANDEAILRELDDSEGIPQLLGMLATKGKAQRKDLVGEWGDFLRQYSKSGTATTIPDTMRRRLVNLEQRGMVARHGIYWSIAQQGLAYLESFGKPSQDSLSHVARGITSHNEKQTKALRERLKEMHPSRFEVLVRDLLEAMGYEEVEVTKASGDKGVDVVAKVQFGITTITEVVQVKRHQANIGRPVLDQLRGALPYHKALRGTIITLGNFTQGCQEAALFPGAAPIGLINGEKLIDLLTEHEIGIKKRPMPVFEVDDNYFAADDAVTEEANDN